jgi:hypothetical protein
LIAVPSYLLALPVLAICGQHVFFNYVLKLVYHVSRLLGLLGLSPVLQREA